MPVLETHQDLQPCSLSCKSSLSEPGLHRKLGLAQPGCRPRKLQAVESSSGITAVTETWCLSPRYIPYAQRLRTALKVSARTNQAVGLEAATCSLYLKLNLAVATKLLEPSSTQIQQALTSLFHGQTLILTVPVPLRTEEPFVQCR